VALHALGAGASAAVFGAWLGALGSALGAPFGGAGTGVVALVAAAYAASELTGRRLAVPQLRRQVPDWWRTFFPRSIAALLYGLGLGVGFVTFLGHGTLVVVSTLAIATGRPGAAALVVLPFGLARGLSVIRAAGVRTNHDGRRLVDSLATASDAVRVAANGVVLTVLAGVAGVAAIGAASADWAGVAGAILVLCFAWSAGTKIVGHRRWGHSLDAQALPARIARVARAGVPAAEAMVPILWMLGYGRVAGTWTIAILAVFSAHLIRIRGRGRIPCGCFGGRRSVDIRLALLRNVGLAGLGWAATLAPRAPGIEWPGAPAPGELLPMVLASVGVLVSAWTVWRAAAWLGRAARA
jgi:hypothetical protein